LDITGYFTAAGASSADVIPSGKTVTGEITYDVSKGNGSDRFGVDLPGTAPQALTDNTVNFAPGASVSDADTSCTGTVASPTAPPGKVCIYRQALSTQVANVSGGIGFLPTRHFWININVTGNNNDDLVVYATWAYTAP
jgi:hypothetical protein